MYVEKYEIIKKKKKKKKIKFRYDLWLLNIQTKVFSNQRSYLECHVFLNYFAIFHINYFIIVCLMPF